MRNQGLIRIVPICIIVLLLAAAGKASAIPTILNGSFEGNTATTTMNNMTNASLTNVVNNVTGTGTAATIDLTYNPGDGFFGDAQDGDWFLSMYTALNATYDSFSIELSEALTVGETYDFSFWITGIGSYNTSVIAGVSTAASVFGSMIYATSAYIAEKDSWVQKSTSFKATTPATYITMRSGETTETIASVDNLELTPHIVNPEPATIALLSIGLVGLVGAEVRRRRKKKAVDKS